MAAAVIPIITAAVPFLFKLFGGGKNKETQQAEAMPAEFHAIMKQLLGDANLDEESARQLWGTYTTKIQEMSDQGYGTPGDIVQRGSEVIQDTGQSDARRQETTQLQERFQNGPNAETTWGDVSSILDQMGIGAGATFDAAEGLIRDSNNRVIGTINDVEKKILEMTGSTFDAAGAIHEKLYGELRGRMGEGFKEQRGQLGQYKTDATGALKKYETGATGALENEYKVDANAAIDRAFAPDATSARVGRAFAPAAADAAFRARRAGLSSTDPTYNAMASRVEASRSRAVDDALAAGAEKQAGLRYDLAGNVLNTRLGIGNRVLDTGLGISKNVLDTGLGISRDEMGKDINLSTADEAIRRGLILDRGAIDRGTVDTAATRRIAEDTRNTNLNLNNTYRYQDKANEVYAGRIAAATDRLTNSRGDLAIATGLADRRNQDREYQNQLRERQYNVGMGFTTADLARKDRGTDRIGQASNDAFQRNLDRIRTALGAGNQAAAGYNANANRANANSGSFSSLVSNLAGSVGGAASDYFKNRRTGQAGGGTTTGSNRTRMPSDDPYGEGYYGND
jgi:hypothetical protein